MSTKSVGMRLHSQLQTRPAKLLGIQLQKIMRSSRFPRPQAQALGVVFPRNVRKGFLQESQEATSHHCVWPESTRSACIQDQNAVRVLVATRILRTKDRPALHECHSRRKGGVCLRLIWAKLIEDYF